MIAWGFIFVVVIVLWDVINFWYYCISYPLHSTRFVVCSSYVLYLGMLDIDFSADIRHSGIPQLLISDTDITRYRYMQAFYTKTVR